MTKKIWAARSAHTIRDWLSLHEIGAREIECLLMAASRPDVPVKANCVERSMPLSARGAWALAGQALSAFFPRGQDLINCAKEAIETESYESDGGSGAPYTIDRGRDDSAHVVQSFAGSVADVVAVAHEFGHAVQLRAAQGLFIPPILREMAAFISELALLDYLKSIDHACAHAIADAHLRDTAIYMSSDFDALMRAIECGTTEYNYRWNYPPARALASVLFGNVPRDALWRILIGKVTFPHCINISQNTGGFETVKKHLPEVPKAKDDCLALGAYRSLGMMPLRGIESWQGASYIPVGECHETFLRRMRERTARVVIGDERKPVGHTAWDIDETASKTGRLPRQSAPLGDHFELQRRARSYLPEDVSVHARCARQEQAAW
ncbi:hypothetical protein [Tropicibacter naphthalenivorans]|nr:hypothetical protein [Tropicibacter naphthalenivorans]